MCDCVAIKNMNGIDRLHLFNDIGIHHYLHSFDEYFFFFFFFFFVFNDNFIFILYKKKTVTYISYSTDT